MIYFDEAGYTGRDLRNAAQPYFTMASIKMTDDELMLSNEEDFLNKINKIFGNKIKVEIYVFDNKKI